MRIAARCKATESKNNATAIRRSVTGSKKNATAIKNAWIDCQNCTTTAGKLWMKRSMNRRVNDFRTGQKQTGHKRMPRYLGSLCRPTSGAAAGGFGGYRRLEISLSTKPLAARRGRAGN